MNSTELIKKTKGKSAPIRIDGNVRKKIKEFAESLLRISEEPETTPQHKATIQYILNELDPYERNILLAYYAFESEGPCYVAKLLDIFPSTIVTRVKKIQKKIHDNVA